MPAVWPGRVQRLHLEAADVHGLAGLHRAGRRRDVARARRVDQHLESGQRSRSLPSSETWSWWWWVSSTCVGVRSWPLGRLDQRLHRAAGVDEERLAARLVGDQVGVGQELRVHRALEDHAG